MHIIHAYIIHLCVFLKPGCGCCGCCGYGVSGIETLFSSVSGIETLFSSVSGIETLFSSVSGIETLFAMKTRTLFSLKTQLSPCFHSKSLG
jgi:hypothetical protein